MRIELLDHLGDIFHRIPYIGIAVVQVYLIAYAPSQQGGVVFQRKNILSKGVALPAYAHGVIVIKSMPLVLQPKPHHHRQSVFVCFVENRLRIFSPPGADGVASGGHYFFQEDRATRPFHIIGFAIAQQGPFSSGVFADFGMYNLRQTSHCGKQHSNKYE